LRGHLLSKVEGGRKGQRTSTFPDPFDKKDLPQGSKGGDEIGEGRVETYWGQKVHLLRL